MTNRQLLMVAMGPLWIAVLALAYLVLRALGSAKVKQYWGATFLLVISILAMPGAAALHIALPYWARLKPHLITHYGARIALGGTCSVFPANNIWNTPIRNLPVDPRSATYIETIGPGLPLHPDFGVGGGIPVGVVDVDQPVTQVAFSDGAGESDPGPYRIPDNAPIEGGTDGHVLIVDEDHCKLYELYLARRVGPNQWEASSGAIFDLRSNALRPAGWTSSDAAGLPIFPGLVRYDEAKSGQIRHAFRFTARRTRREFLWPARHFASNTTDPVFPPMGVRFRLRASFDTTGFAPESQAILQALKDYGMILADNGGPWFVTGEPDSRWTSRIITELRRVSASDLEAVDTSKLMIDPNSGEARQVSR